MPKNSIDDQATSHYRDNIDPEEVAFVWVCTNIPLVQFVYIL